MANTFVNTGGAMERKITLTPEQQKEVETPKATLVDPKTGDRKAIIIGSPAEKELFGKGYVLEKAGQAPFKPATFAKPTGDLAAGVTQPQQTALTGAQYHPVVDVYQGGGVQSSSDPNSMASAIKVPPKPMLPSSNTNFNTGTGSGASNLPSPTNIPSPTQTPSPATSGAPGATTGTGGTQFSGNQVDMFNQMLMTMLEKSKGVDINDLLAKKRALQRAQYGTVGEATPEELRTLSPSQQASIRSGKTATYRPDMDETEYQIARAQTAIDNFEKTFADAQKFGADFAEKMVVPQSMIDNYVKVIEADPDNLATILSTLNDKSKQAVIGALDYTKMSSAKIQEPITKEVNGNLLQYDPNSGSWENVFSSGTEGGGMPEIKTIDGSQYVWNAETGQFEKPKTGVATDATVTPEKIEKAKAVYSAVTDLMSQDWGSIVGMIQGKEPDWALTGNQAGLKAKYDQLVGLLTLENMGIMKGVLSDSDMKIITSASTALKRSTSHEMFSKELEKIRNAATSITNSQYLNPGDLIENPDGTYSYKNLDGTVHTGSVGDGYVDNTTPKLDLELGFNGVGGDTEKASLQQVAMLPDGSEGGWCGRFVNNLTGLGLGDSYDSKLAKMDQNASTLEPGMVFVMPYVDPVYGNTGHTGIIVGFNGSNVIVKDSNWGLDKKIRTHEIPAKSITGVRKVFV